MVCSACERFIRVPDLGFGLRLGIWVQDLGFGLQGSQNVGLRGTEEVDGISVVALPFQSGVGVPFGGLGIRVAGALNPKP